MSFKFLADFYKELASIEEKGHAVIHSFAAHGVPQPIIEDGKAVLTDILAASIPAFNGLVQVGEAALAAKSPIAGAVAKAVVEPLVEKAEDAAGAAIAPSAPVGVSPMSPDIPTVPAGG